MQITFKFKVVSALSSDETKVNEERPVLRSRVERFSLKSYRSQIGNFTCRFFYFKKTAVS